MALSQPDRDIDIILRAQQGDHEAFGALVADYQGLVFSVALNVTGNWADSEDVTQETFLQTWIKLRTVVNPACFASWLYTVARRTALEYLRRKRNLHFIDIEAELAGADPQWESPAETYARRQLGEILWEEVADLPPRTREALLLFYVENFPIARAAEFLGIREGAFKMRLKYGREKLQEQLLERLGEKLNERRPGERQRNAILALLPGLGLPLPPPPVVPAPPAAPWAGRLWGALAAKPTVTSAVVASMLTLVAVSFLLRSNAAKFKIMPAENKHPATITPGTTHTLAAPRLVQNLPAAAPVVSPPRTFTIAGRLENLYSSRPPTGAAVELDHAIKSLTDAQGAFRFDGVTAGRHQLKFYGVANYNEHPAATYLGCPTLDLQVTDRSITDMKVALGPVREFSGKVVDRDRQPIAGARIRLSRYAQEALSAPDGRFDLQCFACGGGAEILEIFCEKQGYYKWDCDVQERDDPGRNWKNFAIMLLPAATGGAISGRVQTPAGQPLSGFPVRVRCIRPMMNSNVTNGTPPALTALLTDHEGRFKMESLAPGSYEVSTKWWDRSETRTTSTISCEVAMRSQSDVLLTAEAPAGAATLTGIAFTKDGKPAPGAFICAAPTGAPEGQGLRATLADHEGRFQLTGLQPSHALDLFGSLSPDGPAAKKLCSAVPVPGEGISLVLAEAAPPPSPTPWRLSDMIKNRRSNQRPPASPATHLWLKNEYWGSRGGNDTEFVGEFETAYPGLLVADGENQSLWTDEEHMQWVARTRQDTSRDSETLAGRVIDETGRPVPGAWLLSHITGTPLFRTGADGRFRERLYPTGGIHYPMLVVSHPDYANTELDLSLDKWEQLTLDNLTIRLKRGGTVRGQIQAGPRHPLASAELLLVQSPGAIPRQIITDEQGRFTAEHVTSGTRFRTKFLNPENLQVLHSEEMEKIIHVENGGTATVNFGVDDCHVQGRLSINGHPLSGLVLNFQNYRRHSPQSPSGPGFCGSTTTGEGGEFEFFAIPPGPCDAVLSITKGEYIKRIQIPNSPAARLDIDFQKGDFKTYRQIYTETPTPGGVKRTVTRPAQ